MILAYRLLRSCEIAIANMAGSTEQQIFRKEILNVLRITRIKSLELLKILWKYFSPTKSESNTDLPGENSTNA